MKIILSDFDGTIFFGKDKDYSKTAAAVKRWQEEGNLFGMVTGRSLTHLLQDLEPLSITPDYYVLSTGATIYNREKKLIDIIGVEGNDIKTICDTASSLDFMFTGASAIDGIYLKQKGQPDIPYNKKFIAGFCRFNTENDADIFEKLIIKKLGNNILVMRQGVYFDMPHITCGKAKGIERLIDILGINEKQVFCVGDGVNDLDMLERFQSYSLHSACEEAKACADKVVTDISEVINAEF